MNAIKRHPYFTAWIILCVSWVIGGLGWAHHLRQRSRHELSNLAQKTRQRDQLKQQAMPPDGSSAEIPAKTRASIAVASAPETAPRNSLDAFIEITAAKEELRKLAASREVGLRSDESFGFASYAHEGPRENQLTEVHRQLGLTRLVLEKLFATRPEKLLAVQRERPTSGSRHGTQDSEADFFQLDSRFDLRVAGVIEGRSVRVEFTGRTRVLRIFLNSLASAPEPLLVRCVEVEPLNDASKFSVVVESVEPAAAAEGIKAMSDNPKSAAIWDTPPPDSTAAGPEHELFFSQTADRPASAAAGAARATEGFELLAVKREPFRLQLVGYFGSPGDYVAAFVHPGSPETLLARAGHRFESLELTVRKLETLSGDRDSTGEYTMSALLWDERAQATVTLVGRERLFTDSAVAILLLGPRPGKSREFKTGDVFQDGAATCRIESVQLNPAEVVIARHSSAQPQMDRRVLHPVDRRVANHGVDLAATDRPK